MKLNELLYSNSKKFMVEMDFSALDRIAIDNAKLVTSASSVVSKINESISQDSLKSELEKVKGMDEEGQKETIIYNIEQRLKSIAKKISNVTVYVNSTEVQPYEILEKELLSDFEKNVKRLYENRVSFKEILENTLDRIIADPYDEKFHRQLKKELNKSSKITYLALYISAMLDIYVTGKTDKSI